MHLEIPCPTCGHPTHASMSDVGQHSDCTRCQTVYVVPEIGQPVTEIIASGQIPTKSPNKPLRYSRPLTQDRGLRILAALFLLLAVFKVALAIMAFNAHFRLQEKSARPFVRDIPELGAQGQVLVDFRKSMNSLWRAQSRTASTIAIWSCVEAMLFFAATNWLRRPNHRRGCFLAAIVACLTIPLGIILGVVTIVVLRESHIRSVFSSPGKLDAG